MPQYSDLRRLKPEWFTAMWEYATVLRSTETESRRIHSNERICYSTQIYRDWIPKDSQQWESIPQYSDLRRLNPEGFTVMRGYATLLRSTVTEAWRIHSNEGVCHTTNIYKDRSPITKCSLVCVWFGLDLWHISHYCFFNDNSCFYLHIKYMICKYNLII